MKRILTPTLVALLSLGAAAAGRAQNAPMPGQKKPARCEPATHTIRNWELIGSEYVFWDFVLCPPDTKPPSPLVRVWLTGRGDGYSVERWAPGRDGADLVAVYDGKKRAFTLYRDLDAIPLALLKAERRAAVAAETAKQPFLLRGPVLIPLENLTPESSERVIKVFRNADVLVRKAQLKTPLLHETQKIEAIFKSLELPLKEQQ